jgi:hypothetical protein
MPNTLDEVNNQEAQSGEDPFYCLLEDDKLISEVRVTTDRLLLLPRETQIDPNDTLLVIKVVVKPYEFSMEGLRFVP